MKLPFRIPHGLVPFRSRLWRDSAYLLFFLGASTSLTGTHVTRLGLPLIAAVSLGASGLEIGVLRAFEALPALLVGSLAGVAADRISKRTLLELAAWTRAGLLVLVPIALLLDFASVPLLFVIAFSVGLMTILAEVAQLSYVPVLVADQELVEANSKLFSAESAARIAGPGLAGTLVQSLGPIIASSANVLAFVVSGVMYRFAWSDSGHQAKPISRQSLRAEFSAGLSVIWTNSFLRRLAMFLALHFAAINIVHVAVLIFLVEKLSLAGTAVGLAFAALGVGWLLGSLLTPSINGRLGTPVSTLIGAAMNTGAVGIMAMSSGPAILWIIVGAHFLLGIGIMLMGISQLTLRQRTTPRDLHGRMNAFYRIINMTFAVIGTVLGGLLMETMGVRLALAGGTALLFIGLLILYTSPLRTLRP